jgi:hypothetical protein
MLKTFAITVTVVALCAGSAQARVANPHKYLHRCGDGLVKAACTCHTGTTSHYQVCRPGQWCHTFVGMCSM